jgi:hypothetical protein
MYNTQKRALCSDAEAVADSFVIYEWFVQDTFWEPGPVPSDEVTARMPNFLDVKLLPTSQRAHPSTLNARMLHLWDSQRK